MKPRRPPPDEDPLDSFLRDAAAISEPAWADAVLPEHVEAGEIVDGRFRVEALAGSGGMGAVYRASDLATGARAAVKVLAMQSGAVRERFSREARVLAELSHPCIVRYLAHGVTADGLPFLAMDWLEGEDLARRLVRGRPSDEEALAVMRRACEGLAAAHARGVVHRDVKPSNLFVVGGDASAAKVIDFGVARFAAGTDKVTGPGAFVGTAGYMAPEQAAEASDVDARADVYALGCVWFECLTGRPPFVGRRAALLVKVLREEAPPPSAFRPGLPAEVDALMARLLAKDRAARPKDAAELLRELPTSAGSASTSGG